MNLSTDSLFTSSSGSEFLSSTDPTEEGLSDREKKTKRTDSGLLAPIPISQLQEVNDLWGSEASTSLENILTDFDDLFMKHKTDIESCTIAKYPVEVDPGAGPHREGARSPEKSDLVPALGFVQPSLSTWASGIVLI